MTHADEELNALFEAEKFVKLWERAQEEMQEREEADRAMWDNLEDSE